MSQLEEAANTVNRGCDLLRESVMNRDHVPTVLMLIEKHRIDSLRSLGVGEKPGRPADVYRQPPDPWP